MKKFLFFTTLALTLSGCIKEGAQKDFGGRFSMKYYNGSFDTAICVITDKQTGREYLFVKSGYGGGLTTMPSQK